MKKKLLIMTAAGITASSVSARNMTDAQFDSLQNATENTLNEVVVTGTRTPKLLKDSPVLTRVISASDIKKSDATNISDLLQTELPGIEFSYEMNQQVSLNMQGFSGNAILFLVDGERVAGETLDNIDFNRLNLIDAGRVEIVKGAASSLYGSNAVGGVVNIISRESVEPWTLNVNARYGEHNEQRYGLNFSFNAGKFSNSLSAQYTHIDSYNMKNEGDYDRFYGGGTYNIKDRLTFRLNGKLKFIGRAGYFFRERNSAETTHDRYRDFSTGLKGIYDISESTNLEVSYSFDQYDKSDYMLISRRDVRDYSNTQNIGRAILSHTFAEKHILTVGGDVMRDYLMTYQFVDNGSKTQITADGFAQIDLNFHKNFNIITGGRFDYFSEAHMKHFSPRLNAMYKLNRFSFRGSYAGGFRAPSLKEMYMNFDMAGIFMIYGNENLRPESSNNFQLSAEFSKGMFNATLGGFCNLVDNRITTVWNHAMNGMVYTNIGKMTISGVDANVSWRSPWGLGARASYVFTHEHLRKGEPYTSSTRPHTATIRLDYTKNWKNYGLMVALNGRFLSKVSVDEFTSVTSYEETERVNYPGYTIWKLKITQSVWKGIDVIATIDNLFNYIPKYNYSSTPSTTGISFAIGLSLDIDKMTR
ncbi:MAG: TonB-dependent receptor [Prevotella sp.]|nr:TonB-dependent receptor [Bacteroides sp.]MCM1366844.1 TonB-dependent receptor [Prevotella sp.]MCM1437194.1 TonB-dependent receptor [Prevotella sp.]